VNKEPILHKGIPFAQDVPTMQKGGGNREGGEKKKERERAKVEEVKVLSHERDN